ncbi:MAG TPA: PKD domain-containing protein [Longimicrobium sp.]|jgi:hypothetical protein|nr:PKD domain-containing protein [Longimicrobium sp.]
MKRLTLLAAAIILLGCRDDQPVGPRPVAPTGGAIRADAAGSATVTYLGTFGGAPRSTARAINASGVAAGDANFALNVESSFAVRFAGQVDSIPADSLSYTQIGEDINDGGTIVGSGVQGLPGAQYLRAGFVYGGGTAVFLPHLPFSSFAEAYGVNNAGDVVGLSRVSSADLHAVLWRSSGSGYTIVDLGNGYATAIAPNLGGSNTLVVGVTAGPHAFIWQSGVMTELPPPPGLGPLDSYWTEARDVADNGMVVGWWGSAGEAILWDNGQTSSLAMPCRALTPGGQSLANAIAVTPSVPHRVLIVGTCSDQAIVWYDDGRGGYAAQLLPPLPGDNAATALDVNAQGQIVGYSRDGATLVDRAVRWAFTPPAGNSPPLAAAGGPYAGTEGIPVAFDGSASSDPDGQPLTFDWNFGDGTAHGTGVTPSHTYDFNSNYTVTVVVGDGNGTADTATAAVTIANAAPVVSAGAASTLESGQTLAFSGSFGDSGVFDVWTVTIDWGDGAPPKVIVPATQGTIGALHTYFATGDFTLRLNVTDGDGGSGSATRTVTVTPKTVAVSVSPNLVPLGDNRVSEICVTILSARGFDATRVDPASVRVGNGIDPDAGVKQRRGVYVVSRLDFNRDGLHDLQLTLDKLDPNLGLAMPTTTLILRGSLPTPAGTILLRGVASVGVTP